MEEKICKLRPSYRTREEPKYGRDGAVSYIRLVGEWKSLQGEYCAHVIDQPRNISQADKQRSYEQLAQAACTTVADGLG